MMRLTDMGSMSLAIRRRGFAGRVPVWLAGLLAVLLLVSSGVAYRLGAAHVEDVPPLALPRPLSDIPLKIGNLVGRDVELLPSVVDYMKTHFADDYIFRRYSCTEKSIEANLYVVYCASRPAGIVGHRPRVCYPGIGWVWDETVKSQVVLEAGRQIPCLLHRFHRPEDYRSIVVLSLYVLDGRITLDEDEFSSLWGRRPNLEGDPTRYVAQIQVSSALEQSARTVLGQLADTILAFLPGSGGQDQAGGE
jgi:hypothetical protein